MRATDDSEFESFVKNNRPALVRFARTLTAGDAHLAEDLVQTALVRVYLSKTTERTNLHGYVRRALVNGLIDHKRRPFSRRERITHEVPDHAAADSDDQVDDPQLLAALAVLPVRMRAAVVLRHVKGLTVEETAETLGCSTGNVKSQTSRGPDKLREVLAADRTGDHADDNTPDLLTRATSAPNGVQPCPIS